MDIQINETDYAVSLFIIMENKIALSELPRIDFVVAVKPRPRENGDTRDWCSAPNTCILSNFCYK